MAHEAFVKFTCESCGNAVLVPIKGNPLEVGPVLAPWRGVISGDAPGGDGDQHRWYDSLECLAKGEKKHVAHTVAAAMAMAKSGSTFAETPDGKA